MKEGTFNVYYYVDKDNYWVRIALITIITNIIN